MTQTDSSHSVSSRAGRLQPRVGGDGHGQLVAAAGLGHLDRDRPQAREGEVQTGALAQRDTQQPPLRATAQSPSVMGAELDVVRLGCEQQAESPQRRHRYRRPMPVAGAVNQRMERPVAVYRSLRRNAHSELSRATAVSVRKMIRTPAWSPAGVSPRKVLGSS